MTKYQLLGYLHNAPFVHAHQVAADFGIPYPVAAMALLRLVRQALASRIVDEFERCYRYELSDRGYQRLAYFNELEASAPFLTSESKSRSARRLSMKRKKLHTGVYHCPTCFIELDLVGEESLQCDQCHGPLAKGSLDEVWADDADDE